MALIANGTSVNGAAVTIDIPSASNIVALMAWFYEDGGSAATPSVPAGATATQIGTPALRRAGAAYKVTGLTSGSARVFDPPGSNDGNQACFVAVYDDASDIDSLVAIVDGVDFFGPDPVTRTVTTANANDFVVLALATPTALPNVGASGGSTLIANSAAGGYGVGIGAVTRARTGATTDITASFSSSPGGFTVRIVGASASSDTLTIDAQPTTGTTDVALGTFTIESSDTGSTATVTATKASGPGALSGTTSAAMTAGVVSFTTLEFDAAGTYTIAFNATGHDEVVSASVVVSDPPPASSPAMGRFRIAMPR